MQNILFINKIVPNCENNGGIAQCRGCTWSRFAIVSLLPLLCYTLQNALFPIGPRRWCTISHRCINLKFEELQKSCRWLSRNLEACVIVNFECDNRIRVNPRCCLYCWIFHDKIILLGFWGKFYILYIAFFDVFIIENLNISFDISIKRNIQIFDINIFRQFLIIKK